MFLGHITATKNRFPGPPLLWQSQVGQPLLKSITLCNECKHFRPGDKDHCQIAEQLHQLTIKAGVSTPVTRCGLFEGRAGAPVRRPTGAAGLHATDGD